MSRGRGGYRCVRAAAVLMYCWARRIDCSSCHMPDTGGMTRGVREMSGGGGRVQVPKPKEEDCSSDEWLMRILGVQLPMRTGN